MQLQPGHEVHGEGRLRCRYAISSTPRLEVFVGGVEFLLQRSVAPVKQLQKHHPGGESLAMRPSTTRIRPRCMLPPFNP